MCGGEGSYFSCGRISHASFSSILGLPIAFWGMAFFTFALLVIITALRADAQERPFWRTVLLWGFAFGSLFDVALLAYSIFGVQALCPLCTVTYLANWLALALLVFFDPEAREGRWKLLQALKDLWYNKQPRITPLRGFSLLLAFAALGLLLGIALERQIQANADKTGPDKAKLEKAIAKVMTKFQQEPVRDIDTLPYPAYGDKNAPVTFVEFSDFMCPYCQQVAPLLKKVIRQSEGKANLRFVNFPLDTACNKGMTRQLHEGACLLARAVHCAAEQSKFWDMHDAIFQKRRHHADDELAVSLAQKKGLDIPKFKACLNSAEAKEAIQEQIRQADELKLTGTPALFINGKRYGFKPHPLLLKRLINKLAKP
jgi:protein-disulfide isomerase